MSTSPREDLWARRLVCVWTCRCAALWPRPLVYVFRVKASLMCCVDTSTCGVAHKVKLGRVDVRCCGRVDASSCRLVGPSECGREDLSACIE